MPRVEKTTQRLIDGEAVGGEFWPSHGGGPAHCTLRWTPENGCQVEVIGSAEGWEASFGGPHFTLHGMSVLGDEVSLFDAWVNQISFEREITRMRASTLAVGALTTPEERWNRAIYSTANLGEWYRENGLSHSGPSKGRPRLHRVDFDPPAAEEIELPRATVRLGVSAQTVVAYAPDWRIETWSEFAVFPKRRFTVNEAHHGYAQPLLAFTHFALDRPDSLSREVFVGESIRRRIEVLREGPVIETLWKLAPGHYLFQRPDIEDLRRGLRRWWTLHGQVRPALGLFADHVAEGNSYGPGRLLTLYTALERYSKARFQTKGEFKRLREYADLPTASTGCTNAALKLMGASRGYFAHGETQGSGFTPEEIEDAALESTRRASALMQACLLKEIGIRKPERIDLMARHYGNWPIP
jgi:ApeA-like protein